MNKRAGYIAFITLVYLALIAILKLEEHTFLAFVAFPLGLLQQDTVEKTPRGRWRSVLLFENIFGLYVGIAIALVVNMFYSTSAYLLLSALATYIVSTQKPTIASTIFATIGMMYATSMQPSFVFGMMLSGFILSQLATFSGEKIRYMLERLDF